ncbi:hypothetical protein [Streptomyces alboniger]|uniref:hypothetical protein n=1 Tax=Streptomyces alboniger TaxID=132473 RepID=UPI00123D8E85|nr:hypothetical protein [Streptomyces alboniger]
MSDHEELPAAVHPEALLALAHGHHDAPRGRRAPGRPAETYRLEAPGRAVTEQGIAAALRITAAHL